MNMQSDNLQTAKMISSFLAGVVLWGAGLSLVLSRGVISSLSLRVIALHGFISISWFASSKKKPQPNDSLKLFLFPLRTVFVTLVVFAIVWVFLP